MCKYLINKILIRHDSIIFFTDLPESYLNLASVLPNRKFYRKLKLIFFNLTEVAQAISISLVG